MRSERMTPADALGYELKHLMRREMQTRATTFARLHDQETQTGKISKLGEVAGPFALMADTLAFHIDDLGINWTNLVDKVKPSILRSTLFVAMRYAYEKIGGDFADFFSAQDASSRWGVLRSVLDDEEGKKYFHDNLTKLPITHCPERAASLPYILHHEFGDKPLIRIDLGAGIHGMIPSLTSPDCLDEDFPGKETMTHLAKPVQIQFGLGVDMQQVDTTDVDWIGSCSTDIHTPRKSREQFKEALHTVLALSNQSQFPFLAADIHEADTMAAIKELLPPDKNNAADFVVTSFMTHQAFATEQDLRNFQPQIAQLLSEGGVWINIAEELLTHGRTLNPSVRVYKKTNGAMELKGIPFILQSQGKGIASVDPTYFTSPLQPSSF